MKQENIDELMKKINRRCKLPKNWEKFIKETSEKHNIIIKGIDMQNAVEISKKEQRDILINNNEKDYQAKIRKSNEKLKEWKEFFEKDSKKYFS